MKIRVWGTLEECNAAQDYYLALGENENVKSVEVSRPYPNRNSVNVYRVYITVEYYNLGDEGSDQSDGSDGARPRPSGSKARKSARAALPNAGKAVRRGS